MTRARWVIILGCAAAYLGGAACVHAILGKWSGYWFQAVCYLSGSALLAVYWELQRRWR